MEEIAKSLNEKNIRIDFIAIDESNSELSISKMINILSESKPEKIETITFGSITILAARSV